MKKKFVVIIILTCSFILFACNKLATIDSYMSEITEIYFEGKDENNSFINSSISIGYRETPYFIDGVHQEVCEFSLVVLDIKSVQDEISVQIVVNNEILELILFYNPSNSLYMADIGYALKENDKICLLYGDYKIEYQNLSNDFEVSYKEALEISSKLLKNEIKKLSENSKFNGECYLKILKKNDEGLGDLFWAFTLIGRNGEVNNVVISVYDKNIVFSD